MGENLAYFYRKAVRLGKTRQTIKKNPIVALCHSPPFRPWPIRHPSLESQNHPVERVLFAQTLEPVDGQEHVAQGERIADVRLGVHVVHLQLYGLWVGRHGQVKPVLSAADEQIVLHISLDAVNRRIPTRPFYRGALRTRSPLPGRSSVFLW